MTGQDFLGFQIVLIVMVKAILRKQTSLYFTHITIVTADHGINRMKTAIMYHFAVIGPATQENVKNVIVLPMTVRQMESAIVVTIKQITRGIIRM